MAEGTAYVLHVTRVEAIAADDGVTFEIEGGLPSPAAKAIEKRLKDGTVKFEDVDPEGALWVDGEPITTDVLKQSEKQEVWRVIDRLHEGEQRFDYRLNAGEGGMRPFVARTDADETDLKAATVFVVKRRTDPEYTIEQALDLTDADLTKPSRPTRRGK